MSLLEQDITKKEQMKTNNVMQLDTGKNSRKYKKNTICNSIIYAKKLKLGHLPKLYYLIF